MRKEFEYIQEGQGGTNGLAEGLCSTCKHKLNCTFPSNLSGPRLYCEEFECEGASDVGEGIGILTTQKIELLTESRAVKKDTGKYMGLCVNCENRESCTLPKPAGGVWYCEEYQ